MRARFACGCALALAVIPLAIPARAQAPRDVATEHPERTYSANLGGLSHVLGGAHYIRRLCSGRADQSWREQMRHFMDLEGPPGTPQRQVMVQEFNAGYREQEERYPACTPEAQTFEGQLKRTGARLASALAARYRN